MPGAMLTVPPLQADSCREAIRTFLSPMSRSIRAVQAKLTRSDGVVFASELWMVEAGDLSGIAAEIAAWIASEASGAGELQATVTVWDGKLADDYLH